jgi:hypothetical protein
MIIAPVELIFPNDCNINASYKFLLIHLNEQVNVQNPATTIDAHAAT